MDFRKIGNFCWGNIFTKGKINNTEARHKIFGTTGEFPGYHQDVIEAFTLLEMLHSACW